MTEPPGARLRVGALRADRRRVLPRRGRQGRAALHRQHLPLHAGGLGSVGAARPHAVGGRLSADAAQRDGTDAGTHHVDQEGLDHLRAGDLRAGRRLHRPGAGHDLRPSGRDDEPVAHHFGAGHLPGRGSAGVDVAHSRCPHPRRRALQRRAPGEADPAALQGSAGHHRDSRHRRAVGRRQARPCRARARSRTSCRSPSSSPSSSPASRASTCRSPTRSAASRRSSRASTTTSPSRTSTWPAPIDEVVEKARQRKAKG